MKKIFLVILFFAFISASAHSDKWDTYKQNWSPLMLAIYNGKTEEFKKLMKNNIDINYIAKPKQGSDLQLTALEVAIRVDNVKAINALIETNKISRLNESLMTACGYERASTVNLLIKHGANPSYANQNGHTVGMVAVSFGSLEVLKALLDNGADVNQARGIGGMTMLMFAAFNGDINKTKLLLEYKADKQIQTKKGKTASDYVNEIYPSKEISEETKTELRKLLQ